jgi:hypothetical protein
MGSNPIPGAVFSSLSYGYFAEMGANYSFLDLLENELNFGTKFYQQKRLGV